MFGLSTILSPASTTIVKDKTFIQKKFEFEEKFKLLMFELNMFNKDNKTFALYLLNETNYGFEARIYNVVGLSLNKLNNEKAIVQETLCCLWIMKVDQFQDSAFVKIITNPPDKSIMYENPNVKPWEVYLGMDFSLKQIKLNVNDHHMFMLGGSVGSGKTRFLYMMLLSWIVNCSPNDIEIYLSDIAKNEFIGFQKIPHIKEYAYELEQLLDMLQLVKKKLDARVKVMAKAREKGIATNILEYNRTHDDKMTYCYVLIDEVAVTMVSASDNKIVKAIKQEISDIEEYICRVGRAMGIYTIMATQKALKAEMNPSVKSNSEVRISFRANDGISSEVIMGDYSALGLANRIAIYSLNGGMDKDYIFSPTLETITMNKMLKPYIKGTELSNISDDTIDNISAKTVRNTILPKKDGSITFKLNMAKIRQGAYIKREDELIDY